MRGGGGGGTIEQHKRVHSTQCTRLHAFEHAGHTRLVIELDPPAQSGCAGLI